MESFTVAGLTTVLARMLPEPQAGLLGGILFGTRATLTRDLTDAFITTGTIHIIALSGQNLSIFTGVLATWLASLVSRRLASVLILFLLVWFLWFVGPSPSLVRAVIMGSLTLIAVIFGRRNLGLLSLVLAVGSMLVLNPPWIGDLSFQLSVLATLGIILFGGKRMEPIERFRITGEKVDRGLSSPVFFLAPKAHLRYVGGAILSFLRDDLRLTLSAQLFTTPLIFFHFHRLSLVAPLTNVLIGWTMVPLMVLGWIAAIAGYLWQLLGFLPAWGSWVLLTFVIRAVEMTAGFPLASVAW